MATRSTRIKNTRPNPIDKVAKSIVPDAQLGRGDFALRDVANHDDDDQRAMIRNRASERDRGSNKGRQTVRRLTKIEKLCRAGIISAREAAACEWYHDAHSARYDVVCKVASWGGAGGATQTNFDHLPKNAKQLEAYMNFQWARDAITPGLLPLFERVVLKGRPLGKLAISFRTAARQLLAHIEGRVAL